MKLDLKVLQNFMEMTEAAGNEVLYTATMKDGTKRTLDVNMLFANIYQALKAIEHWMEGDASPKSAANNPTGQEAIGGR